MSWRYEWIDGGQANLSGDWQAAWDEAFASSGNIWQSRRFAACWDAQMAGPRGQRPVLLAAKDRKGHRVVYPLYAQVRKHWGLGFTIVEPMGGPVNCDYQDPLSIADPMRESSWRHFWQGLEAAVAKRFGRRSELRVYRLTEQTGSENDFSISNTAPFISTQSEDSLRSLLARRGRNLREQVGRRMRRAKEMGECRLRLVSADEIPAAMKAFAECYDRQWGAGGEAHAFERPETAAYLTALATAAAEEKKLHFTAFEIGGEPWHWHLGLEHRGSLLWYKMTYDTRYAQHSPGMLHLAMLVEDAIARGLHCIDLGYGAEEYKYKWTDREQPLRGGRAGSLSALIRMAQHASGRGRVWKHYLSNLWGRHGRPGIEA